MEAMVGWQPPHLVIEHEPTACSLSQWAENLSERSARIRDVLEEELSAKDFIEEPVDCFYSVGDHVMLQTPDRSQKCIPPYEPGWVVLKVISKSTVIVSKPGRKNKTVNVALLKLDPVPEEADSNARNLHRELNHPDPEVDEFAMDIILADDQPAAGPYGLRDRSTLHPPTLK